MAVCLSGEAGSWPSRAQGGACQPPSDDFIVCAFLQASPEWLGREMAGPLCFCLRTFVQAGLVTRGQEPSPEGPRLRLMLHWAADAQGSCGAGAAHASCREPRYPVRDTISQVSAVHPRKGDVLPPGLENGCDFFSSRLPGLVVRGEAGCRFGPVQPLTKAPMEHGRSTELGARGDSGLPGTCTAE